jgi:signal transduction histidine kinase
MDGYDVIASLKKSEKTKDIPVIFVSSLNDVGDEKKGLTLGAMDYITKPFSSAIVKLRVQNQIKLIIQTRLIMEKEIAEKKLIAESNALEHANLMKTEIMQTISHETRTPLAVIMSYAEVTAREARKSGVGKEFVSNLDTIAGEARRMAEMMEDLRQTALMKEVSKKRTAIDLKAFVSRISGLYSKLLELNNIKLNLDIPDGLPHVYCNENELMQVFINLLRNSEKHTENGSVTISAGFKSHTDMVEVKVSDTGEGISPDILPYVFERGVNGEKESTGYGLAICRDILTSCGGGIRIENSTTKGTDVVFDLILYKGNEEK